MGYSTVYVGDIKIEGVVPIKVFDYINEFSKIRHMKRNNKIIKELDINYGIKIFDYKLGTDGEYYVNYSDPLMDDLEFKDSIIDYNAPPSTQPGLWCKWILKGEKKIDGYENVKIQWNRAEKFYDGYEWLKYIINNFLGKKGLRCEGVLSSINDFNEVEYIFVVNNKIKLFYDYEKAMRLLYLIQEKGYLKNETIKHPVELKKEMEIWYGEMFI